MAKKPKVSKLDRLLAELPESVRSPEKLAVWMGDYLNVDAPQTKEQVQKVRTMLEGAGYKAKDCLNLPQEHYNDPAILLRWAVGQVLGGFGEDVMAAMAASNVLTRVFKEDYPKQLQQYRDLADSRAPLFGQVTDSEMEVQVDLI